MPRKSRPSEPAARRAAAPAGYSGKPLAQKLGIKPGQRVAVAGEPDGYRALLGPLPPDVSFVQGRARDLDLVHLFVRTRSALARELPPRMAALRPAAALWVSWPKRASGVETDVTEDVIRAEALPLGLVDVKVCAVDATWSGLKLVRRLDRR